MSATEKLRKMLDERGVEHNDEYVKSGMPYCDAYEGTYWYNDTFGYVEPIRPKPNTLGSHPELTIHDCTPEQAISATLGSEREKELIALVLEMRNDMYQTMCDMFTDSGWGAPLGTAYDERIAALGIEAVKR